MPVIAVLGFGSNCGKRKNNLKKALKICSLSRSLDLLKVSSLYETDPWGYKDQNKFLNCIAVFLCRSKPLDLLKFLKDTEKRLGRKQRGLWQPREIDIDILFYSNRIFNKKNLKIPHPRLHLRNFVLIPLVEVMPGFKHPVLKKTVKQLCFSGNDSTKVKFLKKFVW
ncbi:MAG: 7, 8-Dihydro-6-hydroxymethylpterin-pyrophosphokinase [Chlorobi bacterium OLB5]|nr:MAG: 7, 8-Dihydro-6-hydroxymethylpterin-pyrophosphokinase [Chlorobi bacterium OLB5]